MRKFVTISYYPYSSKNGTTALYCDGTADTPFKVTLNVDSIMSIFNKPRQLNTYASYDELLRGNVQVSKSKDGYLLETNAGVGRGINGVDFKFYFITEESYNKLMDILDQIS